MLNIIRIMNCVKIVSSKNIEWYEKSVRGIQIKKKKNDLPHIQFKLDMNWVKAWYIFLMSSK